ncbi:SUMO1 sentrin specific peptidase 1 [Mycoemilia scoparia]|uniref:SUMO1 sentrin specific peptidase 1 n=1 Tax=Mycoemilia scoparia TaxID=417184 RepID=A0A9W8DWJ2_9FUNG|nr:SUMO1 sentrin specific peptidase 1 [Mycoemilia scoparia]
MPGKLDYEGTIENKDVKSKAGLPIPKIPQTTPSKKSSRKTFMPLKTYSQLRKKRTDNLILSYTSKSSDSPCYQSNYTNNLEIISLSSDDEEYSPPPLHSKIPFTPRNNEKFVPKASGFSNIDWIQELREKLENTLRLNKTTKVSTPSYNKLLEEDSSFDRLVDKSRNKASFPPFPPDVDEIISEALSSSVVTEKFNIQVTGDDLSTLENGNWLNDEVINFYMQLIVERSKDSSKELPSIHAFNTFFYTKLSKEGYSRVRRWTRKVSIFEKDIIIVPVHLGVHWCLAAIWPKEKKINYYDSMGGTNTHCLEILLDYLGNETKDKLKKPFDADHWVTSCPKDIPMQANGYDCGVFSCTFAEYLTRRLEFTFSQKNMIYIRKKMMLEIIKQSLLT